MMDIGRLTYSQLNTYFLLFISLIIPGAVLLFSFDPALFLKLDSFKLVIISLMLTLPVFSLFYLKLYRIIPANQFTKNDENVSGVLMIIPAFVMLICFVLTITLSLISWGVLLMKGFIPTNTIRFGIIYGIMFYCISLFFLVVMKYEWFLPKKK